MNQTYFPIFVAAGTFLRNFLVHGIQGNWSKGAVIGWIAAVLVLCIYYAASCALFGRFQ